ncbi:MAG: DUF1284 domain-containing protein [Thermodesulfovibrionaceae bacterium]
MPNLRGHHLICINFFQGEGYNEAFTKNLEEILRKIEREDINVIEGGDDICKSCPYFKDNKCKYEEEADEEIKKQDEIALKLLNIQVGDKVSWESIKKSLPDIFSQWCEKYCYYCDWLKICQNNHYFQKLAETYLTVDKKILFIFLKVRESFPEVKDSVSLLKPYAHIHYNEIEDKVFMLSKYYQLHLHSPGWIIKTDEFEETVGFKPDLFYKSAVNTYIMSVLYKINDFVTEGIIAHEFSEALALSKGIIATHEDVDLICAQKGYGKQLLYAFQHDLFPGMVTKLFVDREDIQRRMEHLKKLL